MERVIEEPLVYVDESFLNVFDKLIENHEVVENKYNLFSLKVKDKDFDYNVLINELVDVLVNFCISPKEYEDAYSKRYIGKLSRKARESFREYARLRREGNRYKEQETTDGEVGELLLYALLESHLKAPKILTKMRFKTSNNDPVKRSDGIHMLIGNDGYHKLIYGESKLYKDFNSGINEAFKSISEFKTRDDNNIDDEYNFLISNIDSELIESQYEYVRSVLIPKECDEGYDTAFAIFLGFEIEIQEEIKTIKGREYKINLKKYIRGLVEEKIEYMEKRIDRNKLRDHEIFIYFIPFTNINKTKLKILEGILR